MITHELWRPRHAARRRVRNVLVVAAALGLCAVSVRAHHSGAGVDRTRTVTVTGVVKDFRWTNPHSWIDLEVVESTGARTLWSVEMNPPSYLVRAGWKSSTLKPGDRVSVTLNPIRTGEPGGIFVSVTLADGQVLGGRGGAAPPSPAPPR